MKSNKLPLSLIRDNNTTNGLKQHQAKMELETSPYSDTFGPKAQRKRVKLGVSSLEDLAGETVKMHDTYLERQEQARLLSGNAGADAINEDGRFEPSGELTTASEPIFSKGQSKRIWNELYKVIDSSDVLIHVLDARDPLGTRCRAVEEYIRKEAPHKHLIFVLNKVDLVPNGVAVSDVNRFTSPFVTPLHDPLLSQDSFQQSMEPSLLQLWKIDLGPPLWTFEFRADRTPFWLKITGLENVSFELSSDSATAGSGGFLSNDSYIPISSQYHCSCYAQRCAIADSFKAAWVRALNKEIPTLAFRSGINSSFGKGSLINLLRQFSSLHSDRKQVRPLFAEDVSED